MAITINGSSNTITGLAAGGLPDASIVATDLASGVGVPEYTSFNAILGSNQSLSNTSWTTIELDDDSSSAGWDTGSDFDTSNHKWVVPFTGKYFFYACLRYVGLASDKVCYIALYNGGSQIANTEKKAYQNLSGDQDFSIRTSGIMKVSAGDEIYLKGYHNHGSSRNVNASNCCFGAFYLKGE